MPSFGSKNSVKVTHDSIGGESYSRILAIFDRDKTDPSVTGASNRANVTFKTEASFDSQVKSMPSDLYTHAAGQDLAGIFMPYQTAVGSGNLPCFNATAITASGGINLNKLLPFKWDHTQTTYIYDRARIQGSGGADSLRGLISGDFYAGDVDRFRDISDVRGIGIRLPAMGVGWGYATDNTPFPSGTTVSGVATFKGQFTNGWQIDPKDYVAAPFDFRYDKRRNVWTMGPDGFWAEITDVNVVAYPSLPPNGLLVPYYSWVEKDLHPSGYMTTIPNPRSGTESRMPAHEVNYNINVPSGTHVWLWLHPDGDRYSFFFPEVRMPAGQYQHMGYRMVSQSQPGWDFTRSHGLL